MSAAAKQCAPRTTADHSETVPPGLKRTRIGLIPIDWSIKALGPLVTITSGESPSLFRFGPTGTPYFKVDQVNNSIKYLGRDQTEYFIDEPSKAVPAGSVLFPKRGASIMDMSPRSWT
jgi:type I restriction enzyme S subunit